MRYFHFPLDVADPTTAFMAFKDDPYALLFDSSDSNHALSHGSYICLDPVERIESYDEKVIMTNKEGEHVISGNPFDILKERLEKWAPDDDVIAQINGVHKFMGGAAGYFGYDLARTLEQLPVRTQRTEKIPDMAVGIYTTILAFNHKTGKNVLYVLADNEISADARAGRVLQALQKARLNVAEEQVTRSTKVRLTPQLSEAEFKARIQKVIDYIFAGDIFQANISLPFAADRPECFEPYAHYLHLRKFNDAPFSSFMNFGGFSIASASPESFLSAKCGEVITRPIKGTCPRAQDPVENLKRIDALKADEKCRAENAMIVDLLRNDLSKVCTDYSIDVASLCEVETYAKVNHMVSKVTGRLRPDNDVIDLLKACFPGGSITGAPKIRAMEIIEDLEDNRRGPYCGSLGFIGFDNSMETNLAIRTIVHTPNTISMNVGSGIVADSTADGEYEEIMSKASALLDSFTSDDLSNDNNMDSKRHKGEKRA